MGQRTHWIGPPSQRIVGANVIAGVELKNLWDWNKCACHMLHLAVNASLNAATIDVRLQPLYKLCRRLSRSSVAQKKFKKRQQEVVGGVHSECENEMEVECGEAQMQQIEVL